MPDPKNTEKKRRKGRWLLALIAPVLLLVYIGLGLLGQAKMKRAYTQAFGAPDDPAETVREEAVGLVLSADSVFLEAGKSADILFHVRVSGELNEAKGGDAVTLWNGEEKLGEIPLTEPTGAEGYTDYDFSYHYTPTEKAPVCRAELEDEESPELIFCLLEEVTEEGVRECLRVGSALEAYLSENRIEERKSGSRILEEVKKWFDGNEAVVWSRISGTCVIYKTREGVWGIYSLPPTDGMLGSGALAQDGALPEAYACYREKGRVTADGSMLYLDAHNTITNKSFLVLDPAHNTNDLSVQRAVRRMDDMAVAYENELGYKRVKMLDFNAVDAILSGGLSDYGIINMACHGGYAETDDGEYINCYWMPRMQPLGEGSEERRGEATVVLRNLCELTGMDKATGVEGGLYQSKEWDKSLYFISTDGDLVLTVNAFRTVYQNKYLDNSVIYFNSCYGVLNQGFPKFLLSRGAKAVIGWKSTASTNDDIKGLEGNTYGAVFKSLKKREQGITTPIEEVHDGLMASYYAASASFGGFLSDIALGVRNLFAEDDESYFMPGLFTGSSAQIKWKVADFRLQNFGDVSGKLLEKRTEVRMDKEKRVTRKEREEPVAKAQIKLYHFMDQKFTDDTGLSDCVTDDQGKFTVKHLKHGLYGLEVLREGESVGTAALRALRSDCTGDPLYVQPRRTSFAATFYGIGTALPVVGEPTRAQREKAEALSGAEVTLTLREPYDATEIRNGQTTFRATADASGHVSFAGLPSGRYEMTLVRDSATATDTLELKQGEDYVCDALYVAFNNVEEQLKVILAHRDQWYPNLNEGNPFEGHFAITDLDQNGYLELVHTYWGGALTWKETRTIYEVKEDLSGITLRLDGYSWLGRNEAMNDCWVDEGSGIMHYEDRFEYFDDEYFAIMIYCVHTIFDHGTVTAERMIDPDDAPYRCYTPYAYHMDWQPDWEPNADGSNETTPDSDQDLLERMRQSYAAFTFQRK